VSQLLRVEGGRKNAFLLEALAESSKRFSIPSRELPSSSSVRSLVHSSRSLYLLLHLSRAIKCTFLSFMLFARRKRSAILSRIYVNGKRQWHMWRSVHSSTTRSRAKTADKLRDSAGCFSAPLHFFIRKAACALAFCFFRANYFYARAKRAKPNKHQPRERDVPVMIWK
jgi:hypothetical protein